MPVGDWISAPSPNIVAIRTHNILHGFIESAIPENPLVGPNISGLSAIQGDLLYRRFYATTNLTITDS